MPGQEKSVLLIIADISGYTRFMTANRTSLAHSQIVITELMQTIIRQIELPLQVYKLEGDAVCLYMEKKGNMESLQMAGATLSRKLNRIFAAFRSKVIELMQSNICPCEGCKSVDKLKLKIVLHSGTALFHKVGRFNELSGVDMIIIHRLLKNSVIASEYVLMTEPARQDLAVPENVEIEEGEEEYEEIGRIKTYVYFPSSLTDAESGASDYDKPFYRFKNNLIKRWMSYLLERGLKRLPFFNNLPQPE